MTRPADPGAVAALVPPFLRGPQPPADVRELAGDASTRAYFRVVLGPGAPYPSVVAMRYPDEIAPGRDLPFVNVQRYLVRARVPVPAIYHAAPEAKLLFLEDLGDTTLEAAVHDSGIAATTPLYERCIETLVRIQVEGTRALDAAAMPTKLAFDVAKFAEEIDFFFAHAVREYGGIALPESEERAIEDLLLPVLEELAGLPRVLCHRDYHSRNVMVTGEAGPGRPAPGAGTPDGPGIGILDFQDARMGNVFYDLASLLRDSYVALPEPIVDHLGYAYRHAAPSSLRPLGAAREMFARRLDLAALQRNVKAIGTFGNQAKNRGKLFYLRFIPPTVAHLRGNFERNPEMRALHKRLWPILDVLAAKAAQEAPP